MAQNNPFFGNPLDNVTEEIRAKRIELPDYSEISAGTSPEGHTGSGSLLPPPELEPLFINASRQYDIPANVLMALGQQESSYNPGAVGVETKWGRAKGMMQYIDDTAAGMGITDPFDPAQSVEAAAKQFKDRIAQGYSVEEAIMAHHGGDDRSQWGPKTRKYLADVTAKAKAIRDQWQPNQVKGPTSTAIGAAEEVARGADNPPVRGDINADPRDADAREQIAAMEEQARDPNEIDALTGAGPGKAKEAKTPLDLIRQGLGAANDFLKTPASEVDIPGVSKPLEGPSGEEREPAAKGGLLGDVSGSIDAATEDPAGFTGERRREENEVDAFTGADIKSPDTDWKGWVSNLYDSVRSGAAGSTAASVEGAGLIAQQFENVEASRQVTEAAKRLDGTRSALSQALEANRGEDPQKTLERVQGHAERQARAEAEFHQALVDQANREPDKIADWLREKGVDLGKIAETMQADPEYQGVATDVAAGVGSMLTYLGPGFVSTLMTRGSSAALRGIAGITGASALAGPGGAQNAYERAINQGLPEEEALRISMAGIPAGIVQVAPVATILKKIPQGVRSKAVAQFRHLLESFGAEFTAEGAGALMQNLVEKSYNADKGVWDDSLYQAAIGGSSAALITLGVQAATRGKGIGPIDAGDVAGEINKNIRKKQWNSTPEMEALRVMDPQGYIDAIRVQVEEAAGPEATLDGDIRQPDGPAPEGHVERAALETIGEELVEQIPGERVTVETRTGKIAGTVEDYFEDGEGGFQVQVLSDDGESYVFDQTSEAVIIRDGMLEEDAGESTVDDRPGADATDVPPMANVEAGEAPPESDRPEDRGDGATDTDAVAYRKRVEDRTRFLEDAESPQDVDDLIAAEIEDTGVATEERERFLEAADQRKSALEKQATDRRRADAKALAEQKPPESTETTEAGEPVVEHVTRKGKVKRGVVRDIPKAEATAIDTYAFRKNGGWFLNLDRLEKAEQAAEAPQADTSKPLVTKTDGSPFDSFEKAQRAGTNQRLVGKPVQTEGGWAFQIDDSQVAEAVKAGEKTYADRIARQIPKEFNGHPAVRDAWYKGYDKAKKDAESKAPSPANPKPKLEAGSDAYQARVDDWKARLQKADSVQELESIRDEIMADPERTSSSDFLLSTVAVGRWQELHEQAGPDNKPAPMRKYPGIEETTDATQERQQPKSNQRERPQGEEGGQAAETGRGDRAGQGREVEEEAVAQQYQDAVEAKIKSEKARVMRLRKNPETPENRRKLTGAESRLRNLRKMVFQDPPEGWKPGDVIKPKGDAAEPKSQRTDDQQIGTNSDGQPLYEDENGVRYRVERVGRSSVRIEEPVETPPAGRARVQTEQRAGSDFETKEERSAREERQSPPAERKDASSEEKPRAGENTIFTEDAAEKARALLKSKLGQINTGLDPEMFQAGLTLAGYHVERGARSFSAYARAMVDDLGDVVKPYLKQFYMGLKYDPRATGFEGMDSAADVDAADIDAVLAETAEPDADTLTEPMTLYHGTTAGNRFNTFDRDRAGQGVGQNTRDQGDQAYYSTTPEAANWFAGRAEQNRQLNEATGPVGDLSDAAGDVLEFTLPAGSRVLRRDDMPRGAAAQSVIDKARADGYDAIVFPDQGFATIEGDPAVAGMLASGTPETVIVLNDSAVSAAAQPEQVTMLTAEDMVALEAEFRQAAADDPTTPFTVPDEMVRVADKVKGEPVLTQEQADDRISEWQKHAQAQGETTANHGRIVLSLFEISGALSQPWVDAGYQVQTLDIQSGTDIAELDVETLINELENIEGDVHAVLACPPCTDFSRASAHTWKEKDADGRTAASIELVRQAFRAVEFLKPAVWMMENPPGRIKRTVGMPGQRLSFHPHHFGDPFTKQTYLWGDFNTNLPTANVQPEGSLTDQVRDPDARSETPEGFAYAFFMANNAADMAPADLLRRQYRGVAPSLIEGALEAGATADDIRRAIDDGYNQGEMDDVENALRTMAEEMQDAPWVREGRAPTREEIEADSERAYQRIYRQNEQAMLEARERQEELRAGAEGGDATDRSYADHQIEAAERERAETESRARKEAAAQAKAEAEDRPRPTDDVLRPEGKMPRWKTENAATKYRDKRDLLGVYEVEPEGKGFILRKLPTYTLEVTEHRYISSTFGGEVGESVVIRPGNMPHDLFKALVVDKLRVKPSKIIQNGRVAKLDTAKIRRLVDHLQAEVVDNRDPEMILQQPIRGESRDDTQGDPTGGAQPLVDTAPESTVPADEGTDPERIDGVRPSRSDGDGQPETDRSRRGDGLERGEVAGIPGTADAGGSGTRSGAAGAGGGHRSPASDPLNRREDKTHALAGENPGNFTIPDDFALGQGTTGQKIKANLDALEVMLKANAEGRFATPDEQKVLARYVGWGGLAQVFDPKHRGKTNQYGRAYAWLKANLTDAQFDAAYRSIQDSHYTSDKVVGMMWRAARHFGFKGGRALEPTVGTGNFLGLEPAEMAGATEWHAAELDDVSGRIAQLLYPEANILAATGFQDAPFADGVMDLAIGNPPFGSQPIRDTSKHRSHLDGMKIHNYIIAKSGMHLRPGGVMQMVVTHRFLDTPDPQARRELAKHFKLLGAVRLPNDTFKATAGTEVTTDMVYLQKLHEGESPDMSAAWLDTNGEIEADGVKIRVNRYFQENPQNILGKSSMAGSMYRGQGQEYTVESDGRDIEASFAEILESGSLSGLAGVMAETVTDSESKAVMLERSNLAVGGMTLTPENTIIQRDLDDEYGNAVINEITPESYWKEQASQWDEAIDAAKAVKAALEDGRALTQDEVRAFDEAAQVATNASGGKKPNPNKAEQAVYDIMDAITNRNTAWTFDDGLTEMESALERRRLGRKGYDTLRKLLGLRNKALNLLHAERTDNPAMKALREDLNKAYDAFVKDYGLISDPKNLSLLAGDVGIEVGLEIGYKPAIKPAEAKEMGVKPTKATAKKADILKQRVAWPEKVIESADNVIDGMNISLSEKGRLDTGYIASLVKKPQEEVIRELLEAEAIFYDPEQMDYVTADEYLSGNVKHKLDVAMQDPDAKANVAALEKVQPEPKTQKQITPAIRGTWIPSSLFEDFLEALGMRSPHVLVQQSIGRISARESVGEPTELGLQFSDPDVSIVQLFNAAASGKSLKVMRKDGESTYEDKPASQRVTAKAERMAQVFKEWAYSDTDRANLVVDAYNRTMNTHRQRQWNGEKYLKTVGQSPSVKLRRTQKNAAWRMIQSQNVLTDHVVGSGKTFTLITGIMERKRLGLSRKPVIAVPNHLVVQWASEFYQLYPGARILAATPDDFTRKNRRRLFARMATGDYDAIIMGHSSFGFIEAPEADVRDVIADNKSKLNAAMEEAKAAGESGRSLKQMQKKLDTYDDQLKALAEREADKMGFDFEDMGIDYLAVDEAHMFKNLEYATSGERVVGMNDPKGSKRSFDLYTKIRGLQNRGGGVTFATGTPVSNSLVELYTMMRYLAQDSLKARNQDHFDAWAGAYAVTETRMEYTATQKLKPRRVLSGLANLDGLGQLYREFADIITMEDLKRIYAEEVSERNAATGENERTEFPVPKVKHGGRQLDTASITQQQSEYMDYLVARMQAIEENKRDPEYARIDNPLWVLGDARKMSLDIRVVDPTAERDENGKVMRSARKIKDLYDRWDADKGTQLVFSDLSTPSKTSAGNARKLVSDGLKLVFGESEAKRVKKRIADRTMTEQWKYVQQAADQAITDPAIDADKVERIEEFVEKNAFADSTMVVADTGFSVYDDLKLVLTEMGVPAHEIAFIHDYNTPEQKSRLFARVNSGAIRVLLGSTEKMGAGTNAQERMVGLHHLDAPWRPSDVEQREGRIIRQGNVLYERDPDGFEVEINAYSTNGTSDTVMWQVLERKAGAIEQFRKAGLDSMEEDGADSDQYAEFMATSTGNPVFKLKLEAERDLTNIQAEVGGKLIAVQNARSFMEGYPEKRATFQERIAGIEKAEAGDIVYDGKTAPNDIGQAMEAAHDKFLEDYAAWQEKRDAAELAREQARAEGKKKLPGIPKAPTRPGMMSDSVLEASAYARTVKAILEKAGAGNKGEARVVRATIGNVDVQVERRIRGEGNVSYAAYLNLPDGKLVYLADSAAMNPAEAPTLAMALRPENIADTLEMELRSARRVVADLDARVERESALAKEDVSEQPITDAQRLLDWYKDQVKIAEYEADIKRGERQNRYIAADRTRPVGQFKKREDVEAKTFTIDGETYTTSGLAAVESGGIRTIHDATRQSDGARAMVYEQKREGEELNTAFVEPDKAREQRRSATAQSNARKRVVEPGMSVTEAGQRIRQGRLGDVAGSLLDSGKIRISDTTPGDVPNTTAAYVDENGVINLVARNLEPRYAEATLLHEAFHAGARPLIGGRRWNELQERLNKLHRQAERSTGYNRQFWEAAQTRIAAAEAAGDVMDDARRVEEFGAYALEEFDSAPATLRKWASELAGRVKAWLERNFGIQAGQVTPAQLRALAAAALRNGRMAPSPSFDLGETQLVDRDGNPVPEAERKAEVNKAVRSARKALSVVRGDQGVVDLDGGITRDINSATAMTFQPYTIASMEPQFTPVFRAAQAQMRFRDAIISDMYPKFRAYKELRKDGRARVNQVLELGRLTGMSFSEMRLRTGVENRGFKTVITYDPTGLPMRRQVALNTALSKRGDVIKLTEAERQAYSELRSMFDDALDLFRDQTLIDMGMPEFVGSQDPVADILDAITPDMSDGMKDRYRSIAKMVEEIDQAKKTGYVPLSRYGRFVITVREKIADVKYAKNPEGGFIARGVPDNLADFMRDIGATYNNLEDGWQVSEGQRRQLSRETTRTVYSEKIDPESYANRYETWKASKAGKGPQALSFIKEARARIEAEWGGEGRTISVMDTKKAKVEGNLKLSDIDSLADMAQVDNETWNNIRDDFVKAMKGRGFRKHFFRAENVPGYELDFERAISDYMASMAGYLSRRHHEKQWEDAIGRVKGPNLNAYSKEYRNYVNDAAEEHAVLRQVGFLAYIAGNVSTALLNATQVPIMTMPALSQVMSSAKAARHVTGAYKDALAMTSLWDQAREGWQRGGVRGSADMMLQMFDPKDAPADVRDEVQAAWDDGMFSPQFTHEVMGFSGHTDRSAAATLEKTIDYVATSYTYIERLNRLVTFIAAVRAAKDPKVQAKANETLKGNALARASILGDNWSPKAFGEYIVDESQFLMGKVNRAKMLRSHGAAIFQFMSFVINSLQSWYRWSSVNGRDGKFATAYSLIAISALSGIWGAPGLDYMRKLIEGLISTILGEDEDLRYELREWVGRQTGSDWLGEVIDKGLLYPAGADMSGRIGFMRMLPDMTDPISMFGIPADLLVGRPMRATQDAMRGDYTGAISELSPNFLKNPITARQWSQEGVRSRAGSQALTPEQIPRHAYWYKALGIQPSVVTDAWEYKVNKARLQSKDSTKTSRLINRIASAEAEAARNTDPARQPELEARIDRFYEDFFDYNDSKEEGWIDNRSLQRRVRNKFNEYLYGVDQMGPLPSEREERLQEVFNVDEMLERGRQDLP